MKKKLFLIFFITLLSSIYSENKSVRIELSKESWTIEWAELEGINLSLGNRLLLTSLPSYFIDNISSNTHHYVRDSEREILFEKLKKEKTAELMEDKYKLITERDLLLFSDSKKSELNKTEEEIRSKDEIIGNISSISIDKVAESYPINYLPEDNSISDRKSSFEIKNYLEREGIDYYITGSIEEELDNLFVTITLYSRYEDEPVVIWSGVGENDEIFNYRDEMALNLRKYIFSDNILTYYIKVNPLDALIYVDEEFKGLGKYKGFSLPDKSIKIDLVKEGYKAKSTQYKINQDKITYNFGLVKTGIRTITLSSLPEGAKVYYGSEYIGVTPLEIPQYSYPQKLTLSTEGYMDKSIVIDNESKDQTVVLNYGVFDREDNFEKEKGKFYIANGIFSVSLGVPLLMYAADGEIDNYIKYIAIGNAAFWGGNLFYRLYRYLKAAEISVD